MFACYHCYWRYKKKDTRKDGRSNPIVAPIPTSTFIVMESPMEYTSLHYTTCGSRLDTHAHPIEGRPGMTPNAPFWLLDTWPFFRSICKNRAGGRPSRRFRRFLARPPPRGRARLGRSTVGEPHGFGAQLDRAGRLRCDAPRVRCDEPSGPEDGGGR